LKYDGSGKSRSTLLWNVNLNVRSDADGHEERVGKHHATENRPEKI
jgi:hypothetical protein